MTSRTRFQRWSRVMLTLGACLPALVRAAPGDDLVPAASPAQGLWEAGGVFLVLVLLVALVLAGLAVWITGQLAVRRWVPDDLRSRLRDLFQAGRVAEAGSVAQDDKSFLGQLIARVVKDRDPMPPGGSDSGPGEDDDRLEKCIVGVTAPLARAVNFCSSIMLMAPMLGLLAVVGGTIRAVDNNMAGTTNGHPDLVAGVANASKVALVGGAVGLAAFFLLMVFKRRFRVRLEELRGTARGLVALWP